MIYKCNYVYVYTYEKRRVSKKRCIYAYYILCMFEKNILHACLLVQETSSTSPPPEPYLLKGGDTQHYDNHDNMTLYT